MSTIKTTLITAALGLAVAIGFSALSLHVNTHHGNGADPYDGRSALYGSRSTSTEPTVYADDPQFDHTKGVVRDN